MSMSATYGIKYENNVCLGKYYFHPKNDCMLIT